MENMQYYSHTCLCGCGSQIEVRKHHRRVGIPVYIKGHHFTGKTHTEESRQKIRKANKGKKRTEIYKQKQSDSLKSQFANGRIQWNKNRKGVFNHTEETKIVIAKAHIGIKASEQTKQKMREAKKDYIPWNSGKKGTYKNLLVSGEKNGQYGKKWSKEMLGYFSKKTKELWKTDEYIKKQIASSNTKPNKPELYLQNVLNSLFFEGQFLYVGNFKFFIGGKSPDFIDPINNKIIELYGDYWHKGQDPNDRINYFKQYGYNTLVIWESELKNIENVEKRLWGFIL